MENYLCTEILKPLFSKILHTIIILLKFINSVPISKSEDKIYLFFFEILITNPPSSQNFNASFDQLLMKKL